MEDYTGQKGFRIHSHERDDRVGNNYSPDGGDTYDFGMSCANTAWEITGASSYSPKLTLY